MFILYIAAAEILSSQIHEGELGCAGATYSAAIIELKAEGKVRHRAPIEYLNNIIETDHGKLKRLINRVRVLNR